MARSFENVSPFGDLTVFNKVVKKGERLVVEVDEDAERVAQDVLNWREIHAKATSEKATKKADA